MEFETRYGPLYVTRHAFQRWVQRTGRSELECWAPCHGHGALSGHGAQTNDSCGGSGSARQDGARAGSSNVTMPTSS